jgi:hypothetical protein
MKIGNTYEWRGDLYRVTKVTWKFVHAIQVSKGGRDLGQREITKESFAATATEI